MIAFVFPGQGSQRRGMGQGLFDAVPEYLKVEREVDTLVGYSMRRQCLEDPENRFTQTQFTQPSLYVVNALYYYKAVAEGVRPSAVAGHSVGEYNALLAAGAFDFMTGLRLVKKRGELMAQSRNGGMAAVIGLTGERVAHVLRDKSLTSIDVANDNSPAQIVVSGPLEAIKRAGPLFEQAGAGMYVQLPVSAAFHSRYMTDAGRQFGEFLKTVAFQPLRITALSNVTAQLYGPEHSPEAIRSLLERQITEPVRWTQCVRTLLARGITDFREMGPGNVLTRLVQQIRQSGA